jgi:8-oxo-dGTP pyrophosphatase MutT (NUDIX family)
MHYVLGFQFNDYGTRVALVKKKRPSWQANYWNGIGGGVERGEKAVTAMHREFNEEAGQESPAGSWVEFARLITWTGNTVSVFSSFTDRVESVKTITDEEIHVFDRSFIAEKNEGLLPNVAWLCAMALSMRTKRTGGDGRESSSLFTVVEQAPGGRG